MSFYSQITRFIDQSKTDELKYNTYANEYKGLKVKVSFGQGVAAKIPWISFLEPPFSTSNGIYPVYLLYKSQNLLILAYGVSETTGPQIDWEVQAEKISDFFSRQFGRKPYRYGESKVFKAYDLNSPLDEVEVIRDLDEIISIYKSKLQRPISGNVDQQENGKVMDSPISYCAGLFEDLKNANLVFEESTLGRFISSLLSKRFLILTGLSGSGKTKLAQAFAMWICASKDQYHLVPVGADWTNREPLLGYRNALDDAHYVKPETGVLDLILRAKSHSEEPHFLILDEMNLSHVERYFADFLSAMESGDGILLHSSEADIDGVPSKLKIPDNLFIIGTVNIDETTYMFSPKVLDRANVIEFRVEASDMEAYFASEMKVDMDVIAGEGKSMAPDFLARAKDKSASLPNKEQSALNKKLLVFFTELKKVGAEFGYRSAGDIHRLAGHLKATDPSMDLNTIVDIAVMQKLLPKLHGSRRKLSGVLVTLAGQCASGTDAKTVKQALDEPDFEKAVSGLTITHPLSFGKIWRMYRNAIDNGYASYAEA
jgi:5-methylcytosine-specific restriction protein B